MLSLFTVYAQAGPWDSCVVDDVPTLKCLEVVFERILTISTGLVVVVLFIMFLIGGFGYLTSLGNPEKMKKAQGTLRYAVLGTGLFIVSYLILRVIGVLFLADPDSLFKFTIPGP